MNKNESLNYRIDVAYLGEPFFGFQSQADGNTVQDHLEKAFSTICRAEAKILGGSRTDSGVSAENQVCLLSVQAKLDPFKSVRAVNALLPNEIKVYSIKVVGPEWHPHRSSVGKLYRYRLHKGYCVDPFMSPYVWEVKPGLDVEVLKRSLAQLVGEHDFTSFSNTGSSVKTNVREIVEIKVVEKGNLIEIWFHGKGFLKQMVRNIVGTVVDAAGQRMSEDMQIVLEAKDRSTAGQTAPACGLCLVKSLFEGEAYDVACEIGQSQNVFGHTPVFATRP